MYHLITSVNVIKMLSLNFKRSNWLLQISVFVPKLLTDLERLLRGLGGRPSSEKELALEGLLAFLKHTMLLLR